VADAVRGGGGGFMSRRLVSRGSGERRRICWICWIASKLDTGGLDFAVAVWGRLWAKRLVSDDAGGEVEDVVDGAVSNSVLDTLLS
jgi:hypothetical protein